MITADAMDELCALMEHHQLSGDAFAAWANKYSPWLHVKPRADLRAEPSSAETARQRVRQFDAFLMQPGVESCRFTRAIIAMRNVFARYAGLALSGTVSLT